MEYIDAVELTSVAADRAFHSAHRFRVGAVCFDAKKNIISYAVNSMKTHPYQAKLAKYINPHKIYLHAEIAAIIKAKEPIFSISVARLGADGSWLLAKPCAICSEAIKLAGITWVIYSNEHAKCTMEKVC